MNELDKYFNKKMSFKDIFTKDGSGSFSEDFDVRTIKDRKMENIKNYIKEHYDMSLDELDEFIMKYEPERTV